MNADEWNARYPEGTKVDWIKDNGEVVHAETRGAAETLPSGLVVVPLWAQGFTVDILITRIRPHRTEAPVS